MTEWFDLAHNAKLQFTSLSSLPIKHVVSGTKTTDTRYRGYRLRLEKAGAFLGRRDKLQITTNECTSIQVG